MGASLRFYLMVGVAALTLASCGKDDQAARLKQADDLAKGIEADLTAAEGSGRAGALHHDKVTVVPADAGDFLVTIAGLKYGIPTATHAEIGDITYHMQPKDNGDFTANQLALAHEIPLVGADGKTEGSLKLEPGNFQGVYSKAINTFTSFDWQVKNIDARGVDPKAGALTIQSVELKVDTTDKGKGIVDQATSLVADGFAVTEEGSAGKFTATKLTGTTTVADLDVVAFRAAIAKLRDLGAKMQAPAKPAAGQTAADTPAISDDDRKAAADLIRQLPKTLSGFGYTLTAEGLTGSMNDAAESFKLASAGFDLGAKGLNAAKSELDLEIKHDGLVLDGAEQDPVTKALVPHSGNLSFSLLDIPTPALVEAVAQSLPNLMTGDKVSAQMGVFMLMGSMSQLLQTSEIKLKINPSGIAADQTKMTASGDLKVATTPYMAVGTVTALVTGLDDLIATLGGMPADKPDVAGAISMLQSLKAYGQRAAGGDGKPVDTYKFDLTPDGQMLVNGKPLQGL